MSYEPEPTYELVNPRPASLVESLRAVGYDLTTAIADLIDNSISAGARNVWLNFDWAGSNSEIAIIDDGGGMDAPTLQDAMRIGSRNPMEERAATDLGRFGLGLKTASFSQARKLTVASRTDGTGISARCWDLDYIGATGEWRLLDVQSDGLGDHTNRLSASPSGTVVIWSSLDRIVGNSDENNADHHSHFLGLIQRVENHLAMVFHRFLDGVPPLKIFVNGNSVKPWDPYCMRESATRCLTDESISLFGERLSVRPFVLPHHSKLSSEKLAAAAGPKNWLDQQGFYVYRNKRLLVGGDWLGLGLQKEDHYKLARIAVDIPNCMDASWQIDIKKSRATPPASLRKNLRRIAQITRREASEVYRHRGKRLVTSAAELTLLWEKTVNHGVIKYRINRGYPLVECVLSGKSALVKDVRALLTLIEETIPVPTIIIDGAENPDKQAAPFDNAQSALKELILMTYRGFRRAGVDRSDAITRIMNLEPFCSFPEIVLAMPADADLPQE